MNQASQNAGSAVEWAARIGFATKGVLYAVVGILAINAAFGSGDVEGSKGAIQEIGSQSFGQILLWLTAAGLIGYGLWRIYEAAADPDRKGTDGAGVIQRIGIAISGLAHLALALWTVKLAIGAAGGGDSTEQEWTAKLMSMPFGQWLVAIVGVIVIGVGVSQFYGAYTAKFMERYRPGSLAGRERTWARRCGRFGLSARGVTFGIIGGFLVVAAYWADPEQTRGLRGALNELIKQPFGPWLLTTVALGLFTYGVHCGFEARYRHIR